MFDGLEDLMDSINQEEGVDNFASLDLDPDDDSSEAMKKRLAHVSQQICGPSADEDKLNGFLLLAEVGDNTHRTVCCSPIQLTGLIAHISRDSRMVRAVKAGLALSGN